MEIRERRSEDLDDLEQVARATHQLDGYPIRLPDGDYRRFLTRPASNAAWVASSDDAIVGHVALNAETSAPVMHLVAEHAAGRPVLYVARLLVEPRARRRAIGAALLHHASSAAVEAGTLAALDVLDIPTARPAIALYRAAGWHEIGSVSFELSGHDLTELIFVWDPPNE